MKSEAKGRSFKQKNGDDDEKIVALNQKELKQLVDKVSLEIDKTREKKNTPTTKIIQPLYKSYAVAAQVSVIEAKHHAIWNEETVLRQEDLEEKITGEPPGVEYDLAGRTGASPLRRPSTLLATHESGKTRTIVDPEYALTCLEALEKMSQSDRMTPLVSDVLASACKTLRRGLYSDNLGDSFSRNFYCVETGVLQREIQALREQCMQKQAKVGSLRNEYTDLVHKFAKIEDELEVLLEDFHQIETSGEADQLNVKMTQERVDEEVRKQEQFAQTIEEQTKAVYRISQQLYEATNRRRDLRTDLRRAKRKFETFRDEMELNKGTVSREEYESILQEVSDAKDRLAVSEAAMQMRQTAYLEVVHEIQSLNEELRRERAEYAAKVEKEKEIERSLTPRPNLKEAIPMCSAIVRKPAPHRRTSSTPSMAELMQKQQASGEKEARGRSPPARRNSGGKLGKLQRSSTKASVEAEGGAFVMRGASLRKGARSKASRGSRSSTASGSNASESRSQSLSKDGKLPISRKSVGNLTVLTGNLRGRSEDRMSPTTESNIISTKEAVLEIAKEIERLGLDGPKLMRAHEELRELQVSLRDARSRLKIAESYVTLGMTMSKSKTISLAGHVTRLRRHSKSDPVDKEWFERELHFITNKRGELSVQALGRGPRIPQFLKYDGQIQIRMIPRGELLDIVHDVWNFKLVKEKSSVVMSSTVPLSDAFYQILKNRYGLQAVVAKWAYNILYSLDQLKWDPDLELFRLALIKEIPEGTYVDQQVLLTTLRSFFQRLSSLDIGGSLGEVSKNTLFASLVNLFPHKKDHFIDELEECINNEQPMPLVFIDLLLETQEDGGQLSHAESFLAVVKRQHLEETRDFYAALIEGLHIAALKYGGHLQCKLADLTQLIHKIDESIQDSQLEQLLRSAFPMRILTQEDARMARRLGKFPEQVPATPNEASNEKTMSNESVPPPSSATTDVSTLGSPTLDLEFFNVDDLVESLRQGTFKPSSNFEIDPEPVIQSH